MILELPEISPLHVLFTACIACKIYLIWTLHAVFVSDRIRVNGLVLVFL